MTPDLTPGAPKTNISANNPAQKEAHSLILRAPIVQSVIGPCPRHEVVVIAVKKAVSAATMTVTAISMMRFFILVHLPSVKDSA